MIKIVSVERRKPETRVLQEVITVINSGESSGTSKNRVTAANATATSQNDGTPYEVKVSRTVWTGGELKRQFRSAMLIEMSIAELNTQ